MMPDRPVKLVSMTERARWMLLTMTLIITLGGGLGIALLKVAESQVRIADVQRQQDRDMCDLLRALLPSNPPAGPSSTYGQEQRRAVAAYREHRC